MSREQFFSKYSAEKALSMLGKDLSQMMKAVTLTLQKQIKKRSTLFHSTKKCLALKTVFQMKTMNLRINTLKEMER